MTRRSLLQALAAGSSFCLAGHGSARVDSPLASLPATVLGQWIWTRQDADLFQQTAARFPFLVPGVLVGTVRSEAGMARLHRGLSPRVVASSSGFRGVAAVVRLDDSLHALWSGGGPRRVARMLGELLGPLLREVALTNTLLLELQLDYDVPVRRLGAWSEAVARLKEDPLADVAVWVTSLPVHLEDAGFAARLRGVVAGHVLQLFDTGLACHPSRAARLATALRVQRLPYRLGLAAFERVRSGTRTTEHGEWFAMSERLRGRGYECGSWIFPAGHDYTEQVRRLGRAAA